MEHNLIFQNIQVQFFKSIGKTTIEINDLAVFVGKNAAGKSNIVSIFKFLRDLAGKGFQTAVQQQGGRENLFNAFTNNNENIILNIQFERDNRAYLQYEEFSGEFTAIQHQIDIEETNDNYNNHDIFTINIDIDSLTLPAYPPPTDYFIEGQIIISKSNTNSLSYSLRLSEYNSELSTPSYISPSSNITTNETEFKRKSLIDIEPLWGRMVGNFYSSIGIYDFIPKSIKSAIHTTGNATLDEDGGNINIILQNILQDEEKRRTFMNLVRYVLPFIDDVEIEVPRNGLAMPIIRENYSEKFRLPAEFFSDGTATVIAIIVALFFEENSIVVIEEPERYVHPAIMDKLATLFEDAARTKKVVVTTHSPDLIRHLKPEHVQLVSRDKDHFTQIRRVTEDEEIKSFLAGEMQLDDLMVNNFFED